MTSIQTPDQYTIAELVRICAQQSSRRQVPDGEPDACLELFRRAFAADADNEAWQAILAQYERLILYWLGPCAGQDAVQEVLVRFWNSQQNAPDPFACRFTHIKKVMAYLQRCALSTRFEIGRDRDRQQKLWERLQKDALIEQISSEAYLKRRQTNLDLERIVRSRLKTKSEQIVFELTYVEGLMPRDIQAMCPDLFADAKTVSRIKENLLKRLRRDQRLRQWWSDRGET